MAPLNVRHFRFLAGASFQRSCSAAGSALRYVRADQRGRLPPHYVKGKPDSVHGPDITTGLRLVARPGRSEAFAHHLLAPGSERLGVLRFERLGSDPPRTVPAHPTAPCNNARDKIKRQHVCGHNLRASGRAAHSRRGVLIAPERILV
jgi:hypothetical protein